MIYLALLPGQAAQPLAFMSDWDISFTPDYADTTLLGSTNHVYTALLDQVSGDFKGFFDDATIQSYKAVMDGQPRNFYLYPDTFDDPSEYYYGSIIIGQFEVSSGIAAAASVQSTWMLNGNDLGFSTASGYTGPYLDAYT